MAILGVLRALTELALAPFDALPPVLGLSLLAVLTGLGLLFVVRFTTPQKLVERARARMGSAIYETRLFMDYPKRVLIAQGRLILWSFIYISTMLPAFLLASVPLGLLFLHLDARHGLLPLPVGETVVLRVDTESSSRDPVTLGALPEGVVAVGESVHLDGQPTTYFGLRLQHAGQFRIAVRVGAQSVEKDLVATRGAIMAPARARGSDLLVSEGAERPLPDGAISSIRVAHESRHDTWVGMPWWLYWLLAATLAALILKKPLGVEL